MLRILISNFSNCQKKNYKKEVSSFFLWNIVYAVIYLQYTRSWCDINLLFTSFMKLVYATKISYLLVYAIWLQYTHLWCDINLLFTYWISFFSVEFSSYCIYIILLQKESRKVIGGQERYFWAWNLKKKSSLTTMHANMYFVGTTIFWISFF